MRRHVLSECEEERSHYGELPYDLSFKSENGLRSRSAAAHFAFRFHHEKFSLHVGMNISPKGHLHRFADAGRRIRLRLLREMQRHRLPRLKMIRPVAFALLAADFDSVTFLFRDPFFEQWRTDAMGHRSLILDDDPGQRSGRRMSFDIVATVGNGDLDFHFVIGLDGRRYTRAD